MGSISETTETVAGGEEGLDLGILSINVWIKI